MKKISVIIPVYNSERTIIDCLESVLSQTFTEYEVIIVNDGSKDNSINLINKTIIKYKCQSKVMIISQNNAGVSSARNVGINQAKGEYIVFIDSDDRVKPEHLLSLVRANDNAIQPALVCNTLHDEHQRVKAIHLPSSLAHDPLTQAYVALEKSNQLGYLHNKIFNKNIITSNNIYFHEDIHMAEDLIFNLNYMQHVKSIFISKDVTYQYNMSENSLSERRLNPESISLYLSVLDGSYKSLISAKSSHVSMTRWMMSFHKVKIVTSLMSIYIYWVVKKNKESSDVKRKITGTLNLSEIILLKRINLIKYSIIMLPHRVSSAILSHLYMSKY